MKWLKELMNMLPEPAVDKQLQMWEIEREYEKQQAPKRQKIEDDAWDRDIEYRAEKMLLERNHYMDIQKIKAMMYPDNEAYQKWCKYEPLLIEPLGRSACYMIHDQETARYKDSSKIHDKLMQRYKELKEEYDRQTVIPESM